MHVLEKSGHAVTVVENRREALAAIARQMREDREKCLSFGMDGYLSKPVDSWELLEAVRLLAKRTVSAVPDERAFVQFTHSLS